MQITDQEFALVKAGAFATYATAGIPETQWEQKFASHAALANQIERSASLIPYLKRAAAEVKAASAKPAAKPASVKKA